MRTSGKVMNLTANKSPRTLCSRRVKVGRKRGRGRGRQDRRRETNCDGFICRAISLLGRGSSIIAIVSNRPLALSLHSFLSLSLPLFSLNTVAGFPSSSSLCLPLFLCFPVHPSLSLSFSLSFSVSRPSH